MKFQTLSAIYVVCQSHWWGENEVEIKRWSRLKTVAAIDCEGDHSAHPQDLFATKVTLTEVPQTTDYIGKKRETDDETNIQQNTQ